MDQLREIASYKAEISCSNYKTVYGNVNKDIQELISNNNDDLKNRFSIIIDLLFHSISIDDHTGEELLSKADSIQSRSLESQNDHSVTGEIPGLIDQLLDNYNEISHDTNNISDEKLLRLVVGASFIEENIGEKENINHQFELCFVLEFLYRLASKSETNRFIIVNIPGILELIVNSIPSQKDYTYHRQLFLELSRANLPPYDLLWLMNQTLKAPKAVQTAYLEIVSSLLDVKTHNHLHFKNSFIKIHSEFKPPFHGYTHQFWIKFNSLENTELLRDILNTDTRLEDGSLSFYYKGRALAKFNSFQFEEGRYYHIVLLHQLAQSTNGSTIRAKVKLYVDGDYIEQIRFMYSSKDLTLFEHPNEPFAGPVIVGSKICDLEIARFMVINEIQPIEWVLLSYYLGPSYKGEYADQNLIKFLKMFERTFFNLRLLEAMNIEGDLNFEDLNLTIPKSSMLLDISPGALPKELFEIKEKHLYSLSASKLSISGTVSLTQVQNFQELFYSIGALQLLLKLLFGSKDLESLHLLLSIFFKVINANWKFAVEVDTINGYQILATILKLKKSEFNQNLNLKFLDLILEFVGYNFLSPFNSIIANPLAYESLILDFQIWRPINDVPQKDDLELAKYLIYQFQVFGKECKYSSFNALKLKKLRVVKRLLNFLNRGFFSDEMEDTLYDTLLILVKSSLSNETVKSLSSFIVYSLDEGNDFSAVLVLRVLATVFLDPLISNINYWKKLFGAASVKWILLLLQLGKKNNTAVEISLSLLIKIFVMVRKSFEVFQKNNGTKILFSALRDVKIDRRKLNILVKGSFGHYQYDLNFSQLDTELTDLIPTYDALIITEFHYMIVDLLEWTVLHDIFQSDSHEEISSVLDSYTSLLSRASEELKGTQKFFQNDRMFINKLCNLVILLTKPQNTTIYFDSAEKIVQHLSRIILSKIFNEEPSVLETYINSFLLKAEDETSEATKTLFLSLVFPKVIVHLQEFSFEFETLFATNSIDIGSIAVFLTFLNERLLDFEWSTKDYFNYMNVLLGVVEAYKVSGKNVKNAGYLLLKKSITNCCTAIIYVLRSSDSVEQLENFIKLLLFHQQNLFDSGCISNECVSNLICFLLEVSIIGDNGLLGLSLNCLRILLMHRQSDLSSICASITFKHYSSVSRYLDAILTMNDEDLAYHLEKDNKLKSTFTGHLDTFEIRISKKIPKQKLITSGEKMNHLFDKHDQFVKFKYENIDNLGKLLQNDNEMLRVKIVTNEGNRILRYQQDQRDNIQFYVSSFNKLNIETTKFLSTCFKEKGVQIRWTLDYMEGSDRMRKRLLPFDDLSGEQKVEYSVDIPVKTNDMDIKNDQPKNESLSLNSFELIEHDLTDDSIGTYNDKNRKVLKSLFPGDRIQQLWNVSQVIGLEINEGILILGQTHIYLIRNFFHKSENDEIIDMDDVHENERDPNIKLISGPPNSKTINGKKELKNHNVQIWELGELTSVTKRQFLLRDVALEIFFSNGSSFLITSISTRDRDNIYSKLSSVATNSNIDSDLSAIFKETNLNSNTGLTGRNLSIKLANVFGADYINYLDATKKWQRGEMSNFYYLMIINTLAGRTFNDLTQYPVFPWVIADYTSDELDLSKPESFRDLSKPMGAQTPQRAAQFKERYEALQSLEDESAPAFHYGTHYSSAMIVASFLIRLEPFVQSYLLLQGGKFDHADRLFNSVEKAWNSSSRENTTDVRELIPEFFFLPEFLTNINGYEFGKLQDGTEVNHVQLPKWAHGDPKVFVERNREALESQYVSEHLHEWIDLIFGFKQLGTEAVESLNVFNYLSYHGAIDLDKIDNEIERRSITGIIHNFGQTPLQVFNKPHPQREFDSLLSVRYDKLKTSPTLIYQTKFHEPIHYLQYKTHSDNSGDAFWRGYPKLVLNGDYEVKQGDDPGALIINRKTFEGLHDDEITVISRYNGTMLLTATKTGIIHIWSHQVLIKGVNEQLDFENLLRGHLAPVSELHVSPEFNLLLSLDTDGICYLWDLARYKFIRQIATSCDHASVSYDTGMILISRGSKVELFTINGEKLCDEDFTNPEDEESVITTLEFANSRKLRLNKSQGVDSHEFWSEKEIILTGWNNGEIRVHVLDIDKQGDWVLLEKNRLKFSSARGSTHENEAISIVEGYLKSYVNYEGDMVGKVEIVAGDVDGRVAVWR